MRIHLGARPTARLAAVALIVTAAASGGVEAQRSAVPAQATRADIVHVLNRLGYGPAPGGIDRVARMGLDAWVAQQLEPATIDDSELAGRLAEFATLTMDTQELARRYVIPAQELRRAAAQRAANNGETSPATPDPAIARAERQVISELSQQKILRAAYSNRQLEEVLVDFWFNHFNVFAAKGPTRIYVPSYERDAIRPHALGKFRDLLGAVAESPAMLFYLDNWQSVAPQAARNAGRAGRRPLNQAPPVQSRQRGINENFARELMELHTLGVEGGYTQKDVQEIARAFTGWTISAPRQGGGFRFDPRLHDAGEKHVLGQRIAAGGGKSDGDAVLDLLATHPSTAQFIATKLARRFIADDPPKAVVERAARTFRETGGDIREVVRTIVTSPEFFAPAARGAKIKTPLEFVASAVRAGGTEVRNATPLVQALRQLGMPLYLCQPPTGYADKADAWVNTGALLNRMNAAVSIASDPRVRGRGPWTVDAARIAADVLAGSLSESTRSTVARGGTEGQRIALLLGSPEFQKR